MPKLNERPRVIIENGLIDVNTNDEFELLVLKLEQGTVFNPCKLTDDKGEPNDFQILRFKNESGLKGFCSYIDNTSKDYYHRVWESEVQYNNNRNFVKRGFMLFAMESHNRDFDYNEQARQHMMKHNIY